MRRDGGAGQGRGCQTWFCLLNDHGRGKKELVENELYSALSKETCSNALMAFLLVCGELACHSKSSISRPFYACYELETIVFHM